METIALYAGKITQMSGFLHNAKTSVSDLKSELATVKRKCGQVSQSICDLEGVIGSISATTKLQEDKAAAMEELQESIEEFAEEVQRIDEEVAELINENKEDFYSKYSYLKPDCEKNGWEKFCDGCKKTWEWCKENWEAICVFVAVMIAVVAIIAAAVFSFGASVVLLAAAIGALVGVAVQLISDIAYFMREKKWNGTGKDYFMAIFGGALSGILSLLINNPILVSGIEAGISSLFSDSVDSLWNGKEITRGEMISNALVKAGVSAASGWIIQGISAKLSSQLAKLPALKRLYGQGSYSASYKAVITKLKKLDIKKITFKTIRNGLLEDVPGNIMQGILKSFKLDEKASDFLLEKGSGKFIDKILDDIIIAQVIIQMPAVGLISVLISTAKALKGDTPWWESHALLLNSPS